MSEINKPRLIAYYLPQYHPIPENDEWWGKGFTEWTNVVKAKPLFKGHYQPHIPSDLGFYDLRVPEVREAQARLAKEAGIEGFCYWHYWFGGKKLLERPFEEVLQSGRPDYPFCLGWANASWTGIWYDAADRVLMEQTYPGEDDHRNHFNYLLPAFSDYRYMKVDGKPIFLIFQPSDLSRKDIELWRSMARSAGLKDLFLIGIVKDKKEAEAIKEKNFDAFTISRTNGRGTRLPLIQTIFIKIFGWKNASVFYQQVFKKPFHVYQSRDLLPFIDQEENAGLDFYPCVMPGWDNTPRAVLNGQVWLNPSPTLFQDHLRKAINRVRGRTPDHQIIIIKSWNEWAEGNYLEPDQKFGDSFLKAIRELLDRAEEQFES